MVLAISPSEFKQEFFYFYTLSLLEFGSFFLLRVVGFSSSTEKLQIKIVAPISGLFLFLPFLVKIPVYFLHSWLPKAHLEASAFGSIILAGILLKMGSFGLFVIINQFLTMKWQFSWLIIFLTVTRLLRALVCFGQSDQKRMIAFYSINHITFIALAIYLYSNSALKFSFLLIFFHGVISSMLFMFSNEIFYSKKSRLIIFSKNFFKENRPIYEFVFNSSAT